MKKVLVTGGAGFIGSHLAQLLQSDFRVLVLDNLSSGSLVNLEGVEHHFLEGEITDRILLREAMKGVTYVFHLAAMTSVQKSMVCPQECVDQNISPLFDILELAVEEGIEKVILASSASVYGDSPAAIKSELDLPTPQSPYAISKVAGEYVLQMFNQVHGLATVAARFFNVYGPRQSFENEYSSVIPKFVSMGRNHQPIEIYGDGEQSRDFVHVSDVALSLKLAATSPDFQGIVNVGTGTGTTVNELWREIQKIIHSRSIVSHVQSKAGDLKHSIADTSLAKASSLLAPQYTLSEGLKDLMKYDHHNKLVEEVRTSLGG